METVYNEKTKKQLYEEFQRLKGQCYLDHAGTTLYSEVQIRNISEDLCSKVLGNPHSLGLHSKVSKDIIDDVRNRVLKHFHTNQSEYSLIFTSGATAAIRLVFENFDWGNENKNDSSSFNSVQYLSDEYSAFVYTQSNHTSVIGARELAAKKGVQFFCLDYEESFSLLGSEIKRSKMEYKNNSIFAYPAQCNFSGRKYPLDWIEKVRNGALDAYGTINKQNRHSSWYVLLDAATYCSTNDLDLSLVSPDFVCLSFYKIFGYPTGLGALLVRNASADVLRKTYFGGGTVDISLTGQHFHKFRNILHERFEDGTISFLSIMALKQGLKTLDRLNLNMKLISQHVFNTAKYTYNCMKALTHWNGRKLVEFYEDTDYSNISEQGGIINFNLKRSDMKYIGFTEVLHVANLYNIQLRTGCFCNSGACQRHLGLTDKEMKLHFEAGHVCGDMKDLIDGRPTGSIRISFGYMTTSENVDLFISVIRNSFTEVLPSTKGLEIPNPLMKVFKSCDENESPQKITKVILQKIWAYPIKSCGAFEVNKWKINSKGLEYDREWMIVTEDGICLTQKQEPRMSLVLPILDLEKNTLTLVFRGGNDPITIPIEVDHVECNKYNVCESKVCGDRILGHDCGDEVAFWLNRHLNKTGLRLIKHSKHDNRLTKINRTQPNTEEGKLALSNQAQYLLINNESVKWLQERIDNDDGINMETFVHRFRGNFLIHGAEEFAENNWSNLSIGTITFRVDGPCGRCQMICIDQYTGEKNRKPLVTLSRALNDKLRFGIYLSHRGEDENQIISVGDEVITQF